MKNKISTLSVLSVCISVAINAQAAAGPLTAEQLTDTAQSCPADLKALTAEQLQALPAQCQTPEAQSELMKLISENKILTAAGATALAGVLAVVASGGSGGGGSNNSGGTPAPGEGGEVTPPEEDKEEEKKDPVKDYDDYDAGHTIIGDGNNNDLKDNVSVGQGQIGNLIGGDGTSNLIGGDQDVADGGKGTVVVGDDTSTVIGGETIVGGEGSVGTEIVGDNAEVIKDGNSEVGNGGTGTVVVGDGANVGNKGDTSVGGAGSAGTIVEGNKGEVVNDGNTEVSDGGAGTIVKGDDAVVGNKGDTSVGGAGSAGTIVEGNNGEVVNDGKTEVGSGGTGTIVKGDNGSVENKGDTIVGGAGSAGVIVEGDNGAVSQKGDLEVSDGATGVDLRGDNGSVSLEGNTSIGSGATGVKVEGENATVTNRGGITVRGAGATGINIQSDGSTFSNTGNITVSDHGVGVLLAGDRFTTTLDGNVLVDAGANRVSAEGVKITGSNGVLNIKGSVEVRDVLKTVAGVRADMAGVDVSGDGNSVNIDGAVSVKYEGTVTTRPNNDSIKKGISVTGNDNHIQIQGGLNIDYQAEFSASQNENSHGQISALRIDGNRNILQLSGKSLANFSGLMNNQGLKGDGVNFVSSKGSNNNIYLDKDFELTINVPLSGAAGYGAEHLAYITVSGVDSRLENRGKLSAPRSGIGLISLSNASGYNFGEMKIRASNNDVTANSALIYVNNNSGLINEDTGLIEVISARDPKGFGGYYSNNWGFINSWVNDFAIVASGGNVLNRGELKLNGQGVVGISVGGTSTATNEGIINLNAMSNNIDADGNLLTETGLWGAATDYRRGTAILAGRAGAKAWNTGTINVHNAGMGMVANNGTVWNQGTINLTADNALADNLYAMAALGNGVAINDTNGVINIGTDKGIAFYTAGNGKIINRGTVNFGGAAISPGNPNFGSPVFDGNIDIDGTLLAERNQSVTLAAGADGSDYRAARVFNRGNVTSAEPLKFSGTFFNDGGSLQSTGALTAANLISSGTLSADSLAVTGNLHNTGTLNSAGAVSAATLVNQGTFSAAGTVTASTLLNEGSMRSGTLTAKAVGNTLINRGTITATQDGVPGVLNFNMWNTAGATLTNTAQAVPHAQVNGQGTVNALWRIGNNNRTVVVTNDGDMIARNGYSAISSWQGSGANQPWIVNSATGRIIGENPLRPLVDLNRIRSFHNAGEVTVKGDNAVAIGGTYTDRYTAHIFNSGIINVGTLEGKADGSNGTGLIGIKVDSNGWTVNNMQNGVINMYADDSYAFHATGGAKVINNGAVNLLCNSGCGIFSSGSGSPIIGDDQTPGAATGMPVAPVLPGTDVRYADVTKMSVAGETKTITSKDPHGGVLFLASTVGNYGSVSGTSKLSFEGNLVNEGSISGGTLAAPVGKALVNKGTITVTQDGTPGVLNFNLWNAQGATITNTAQATAVQSPVLNSGTRNALWLIGANSPGAVMVNAGDMIAKNGYSAISTDAGSGKTQQTLVNTATGRIIGENPLRPLVDLNTIRSFHNAGEVTVKGNNAVAIGGTNTANYPGYIINSGTINVGTLAGQTDGSNGTGLAGISANSAGWTVNNAASGVINLYADDSYAFRASGGAKVINNGTINNYCLDAASCGTITGGSLQDGDDLTPGTTPVTPNPVVPEGGVMRIANYVVGTNSDGTSGKLAARNLAFGEGVSVDTGFTAGTASKSVILNDVFKADSFSGEENIGSESVVWKASTQKNAAGNLDVKMEKQDYAAIATDASQSSVAKALDRAYTNNALFGSLNVSSAAALNGALKQVSGAQATGLNREARIIGQRFTMLADSAPVVTSSGLSFNVVARGDKRAEMDNKVSYDMMALAQKFDTGIGSFTASYGMARLTGSGGNDNTRAGNNGLTGGYSQFFGLGHSMAFGETASWENSLRMDMHQLDSRRHIRFEGVNRSATASGKQQQLQLRSEAVKNLDVAEGLSVKPFAGMKLRHNVTGAYQESGAAEFNLSQNRYSETAVDVVSGLRINYAGKNGWAAHATLEAGPNLSYSQSARKASLQGLQGQQFSVSDGKKAGSVNGQAVTGVSYSKNNTSAGFNAFHWQEDGAADKGLMLNFSHSF